MAKLHLILGDQLSKSVSALKGCDKKHDLILMCEVWEEATYVKHHKKKIAFLFSAMRHFAAELQKEGYRVTYTKLNDPDNSGSFRGEVERTLKQHKTEHIIVTYPGEYRVLRDIQQWEFDFGIPVEIRDDDRFLCSPQAFADWAQDYKQLRMEYFYRNMRKKYSILMDEDQPVGGKWNYDAQNRKPPKEGLKIPKSYCTKVDNITRDVILLVEEQFADHFGDTEPFCFAVTREQALQALHLFIKQRLAYFGDYQDAMLEAEPWMYHSHISFYLNCGLLLPLECVKAAENAWLKGNVPLNAAEGFIRQILGWREYIRGIYWLKMPEYAEENFFKARRNL
ncbi:MAG: cryptochrome/photolyase family protein, partial [Endozoicomonadaceae bacterium]|nr:cryptochrome/photolyase family protein [Endozoicomonadaceae bacterium]